MRKLQFIGPSKGEHRLLLQRRTPASVNWWHKDYLQPGQTMRIPLVADLYRRFSVPYNRACGLPAAASQVSTVWREPVLP